MFEIEKGGRKKFIKMGEKRKEQRVFDYKELYFEEREVYVINFTRRKIVNTRCVSTSEGRIDR